MPAKDTVATSFRVCAIPGSSLKPRLQVRLDIQPLTPQRWDDLVTLFERPGCSVARGCWCIFYRESGKAVVPKNLSLREARKRSLKKLVDRGVVPGLLGYRDGQPIGWVSLGPRDEYARLARSPVMKPVDDKPVWSIVCFVVDPKVRHQGVAAALLKGALKWARTNGVTLLEAYPVDRATKSADDAMWFGAKRNVRRRGIRRSRAA